MEYLAGELGSSRRLRAREDPAVLIISDTALNDVLPVTTLFLSLRASPVAAFQMRRSSRAASGGLTADSWSCAIKSELSTSDGWGGCMESWTILHCRNKS